MASLMEKLLGKHTGKRISSEASKLMHAIEKHPGYLAAVGLGPVGILGAAALGRSKLGRNVSKMLGGSFYGALQHPGRGPHMQTPIPSGFMGGMVGAEGSQYLKPYVISSWFSVAAGALTRDTDQGDYFNSSNSAQFTTTDRFNWPFFCARVYGFIQGTIPAAQTETIAYLGGFYFLLTQESELARYSRRQLGVRINKEAPLATSGVFAYQEDNLPESVDFPFYFDTDSAFSLTVRPPATRTTVGASEYGLTMEGVIKLTAGRLEEMREEALEIEEEE